MYYLQQNQSPCSGLQAMYDLHYHLSDLFEIIS